MSSELDVSSSRSKWVIWSSSSTRSSPSGTAGWSYTKHQKIIDRTISLFSYISTRFSVTSYEKAKILLYTRATAGVTQIAVFYISTLFHFSIACSCSILKLGTQWYEYLKSIFSYCKHNFNHVLDSLVDFSTVENVPKPFKYSWGETNQSAEKLIGYNV